MIKENIYVAINRNDEIQWVQGSSKKTRYFKTDRYLKRAVEYHNKYHPDDIWKVRKCVILEDEPNYSEKPNNCKDEPQRGCDADCNEDCTECAKETELWKAEQTEPSYDKCDTCVNLGELECGMCTNYSGYAPRTKTEREGE